MDGGAELGEPGSYGPSNPGLMALEDPGAGTASPGAALPKTSTPAEGPMKATRGG
jgi:hypothetical protein